MKRLAVLSLAALAAGAVAWACGPFLPNYILGSESHFFSGPDGILTRELDRLGAQEPAPFKALPPPEDESEDQTASTDLAEVEEILEGLGTPPDRTQKIVESLQTLRAGLDRVDGVRKGHVEGPAPAAGDLVVPAGLPAEVELYLKGAVAWHLEEPAQAEEAWNRLLALPEAQRRHRSTWAAYMLGRNALETDPEEAVRFFQLTRELAAKGFADSLGLAAASLGWEARAELGLDHPETALGLYQRQRQTGDPTAVHSIRMVAAGLLAADEPEALDRVARDPEARAVLNAYVVSWDTDSAGTWLKALKAAGVEDQEGADRLAWAAYLAGDFGQAAAWLDRAPDSSPIARWLRARLLLRDGRLDEARELLAGAARDLPESGLDLETAFWFASESAEVLATPQRAAGEEAVVRLAQKDFTGALDGFLRSGYWMDASYLAEQVLSAGELKAYVDATWPADLAARYQPPADDEWEPYLSGGYTAIPPERLAHDLRDLLGRRLAREGRLGEARSYLTGETLAALDSYSAHLAAGRNPKSRRTGRAEELFQASCVLRHQGMEITGTEIEPDWTLFAGAYDFLGSSAENRAEYRILVQSPEEAARAAKHRVEPRRFHYRYRAADLAWDAAKLLPRGDRKAEMLATAGSWIKNRDPKAADRFYKELVRCCRATDLGREADELRWFPEADACAAKDGDDEE